MTLPADTLVALRDAIARGEVNAVDAVRAYRDRIEAHDGELNCYVEGFPEAALERAEAVDRGEITGPLAGVPIAIKDVLCSVQGDTSCSSKMLDGYRSPFNATVVHRLEDAGAIVLGKTNMDEFAMGSSCEHSADGPTRNPWDPACVPGGSSGGAAAAMAADLCAGSIGSDTGGSIRQPAAYCGVVGLKPTYGRISRYGLVAFASSLDQIGPLAGDDADAALLLKVMAGHDPLDSTCADVPLPGDLEDVDARPTEKLRIGLASQYRVEGANAPAVDAALDRATQALRDEGAEIIDVDLPHTKYGIPVYYLVAPAEASSNLARFDGVHYGHRTAEAVESIAELTSKSRSEGFGDEVKRRIMLGTYALSSGYYDAYYLRAMKVRRLIKADFDDAFERCDAILCPTTTGPAFRLGEKSDDLLGMYLNDIYTVNANLAGIPGISLPAGFDESGDRPLPVGVQLLGKAFDEPRLLRIARRLERALDIHPKRPAMTTDPA
ncbi:MAG: Asp-tRNA(Asn)/Glu-tRNA(Gln) amidotransferase subunit GatA [Phycisphaeraceae bacterium]